MTVYKIKVTSHHEGQEPDVAVWRMVAYSYVHAKCYVENEMKKAGRIVDRIECEEHRVIDIRDKCDQVTA